MIGNPIEYLKTLDVIKGTIDFVRGFSGLEIELFGIDQKRILPSSTLHKDTPHSCCGEFHPDGNSIIEPGLLDEVIESKKPRFYFCQHNMVKVAVPLVFNGEVAGLFVAGENKPCDLSKEKLDALLAFLHRMGNYVLESESVSLEYFKGSTVTHNQELLTRVIKYIWNNAHKSQLSLMNVAHAHRVSYFHLSRLFKTELKTTFVEYRKKVKMHLAAKLLKDCSLTIDHISRTCGFDDPSYFCKTFKRVYELSPSQFRQRYVIGRKNHSGGGMFKKDITVLNSVNISSVGKFDPMFSKIGK